MNKMTGLILMVLGAVSLIIGFIIYYSPSENSAGDDSKVIQHAMDVAVSDGVLTNNEKDTLRRLAVERKVDAEFVIDTAQRRINESKYKAETAVIDHSKKNGDDFEKYIVKKLNKKYFTIKEWAGDKFVNGTFAQTTLNPDLIIEFSNKEIKQTFAIECKWRKELFKDGLEIAENPQLERYRTYEANSGNKVFLAIGLGNEGSSPNRLFIVPLSYISNNFLNIKFLAKFEKQDLGKNLFYDFENGSLR